MIKPYTKQAPFLEVEKLSRAQATLGSQETWDLSPIMPPCTGWIEVDYPLCLVFLICFLIGEAELDFIYKILCVHLLNSEF